MRVVVSLLSRGIVPALSMGDYRSISIRFWDIITKKQEKLK